MEVKVKKLTPLAKMPEKAVKGDACFDMYSTEFRLLTGKFIEYKTGIALEIPEGYVGLLFPRSSVTNKDIMLKNSVGVIDSGYRGEVTFRFHLLHAGAKVYKPGERIGQIMFLKLPDVEMVEAEELAESLRGEGGYGSTGN